MEARDSDSLRILPNIEIFENELKSCLRIIEDKLVIYGRDKIFNFQLSGTPQEQDFFRNEVRRYLSDYKITFGDSAEANYILKIGKIQPLIIYKESKSDLLLNKTIDRRLVFSFAVEIKDRMRNEILYSEILKESYSDLIDYDYIYEAEVSTYEFTKGKIPQQSAFQQMIIPGIVIFTSAVAIVLFFVVRSK